MTITRAQVVTHEASHAAIALTLGMRVDSIRVSGFDGEVTTHFPTDDGRTVVEMARVKMCELLAGMLMEPCGERSNEDFRNAWKVAELLSLRLGTKPEDEIRRATDRTLELLARDDVKALITALASRLSEKSPLLHVTAEPFAAIV